MTVYINGERYVSSLAVNGVGDGSEANPWSWTDARTGASNGMRINVKADGVYTLAGNEGTNNIHYWVKGNGDIGTPNMPVCWRGYTTTPGDGGIVTLQMVPGITDISLATYANTTMNPQRNCWSAINFNIVGPCQFSIRGLLAVGTSMPMLYNLRVENTYTGTSNNDAYAISGSRYIAQGCTFISYHKPNSSSYRSAIIADHATFLGCTFYCGDIINKVASGGTNPGHYQQCVFIGLTGAREGFRYKVQSTEYMLNIVNCVFNNFGLSALLK